MAVSPSNSSKVSQPLPGGKRPYADSFSSRLLDAVSLASPGVWPRVRGLQKGTDQKVGWASHP